MNRFCNDNAAMGRSQSNCGNGSGNCNSNRSINCANGCGDGMSMDMPIAMAYVPWQKFTTTYEPQKALMAGTIFPELDKPFLGKSGGCCK